MHAGLEQGSTANQARANGGSQTRGACTGGKSVDSDYLSAGNEFAHLFYHLLNLAPARHVLGALRDKHGICCSRKSNLGYIDVDAR